VFLLVVNEVEEGFYTIEGKEIEILNLLI